MGWFGMGASTPKCCCGSTGQTCVILADDFEREDDPDLGGDWIEESGAAEVSSTELLVTSNNSQIIGNVQNPNGPQTQISCRVKLVSGSSTARLFLGWVNTSNYLYCTLSTTALTVGITGGSTKIQPITIVAGDWYDLTLCYNGQLLVATLGTVKAFLFNLTAPGVKHGVGSGTASVRFDNVIVKRVAQNCANCGTAGCVDCTGDHDWFADLSDWPNVPDDITSGFPEFNCNECESMAGIYFLEQNVQCRWVYDERFCNLNEIFPPCQHGRLSIYLTFNDDCLPLLTISIYQNAPFGGGTCGNGINTYQQEISYTSATPISPDGPDTIELTKVVPGDSFDANVANGIEPCQISVPPETITLTKAA